MSDLEALQLLAKVIYRTVIIAKQIKQDYKSFPEDTRLLVPSNFQVSLLEEVEIYFSSITVSLRKSKIVIKRHSSTLYTGYMNSSSNTLKTSSPNDAEAQKVVEQNSAEHIFQQIEANDDALNRTRGQEIPWLSHRKTKLFWAIHTKRTAEKLVEDVEWWGARLEKLCSFTIPQIMTRVKIPSTDIMMTPLSNIVSEMNVKTQLLIANREETDTITSATGAHQQRPGDNTYLEFSRLRFNVQTEQEKGRGNLGGTKRRQWAQLLDETGSVKEQLVIAEFKDRPRGMHIQGAIDQVIKQLRSLVKVLRIAASTFQILYCHGFCETKSGYSLVYQLPSSITTPRTMQCETVSNILMNRTYSQLLGADLQYRCDLAKALALTMFHIHSVQWLHKSFNSDNILLFGNKSENGVIFDWTRPYIVGFDASRNVLDESTKLPAAESWEERVYIHPERQKHQYSRFQKLFDIYSLGVVLLEIGCLKSFKDKKYKVSDWSNLPGQQVQQKLIHEAKELRKIMGITYEEIVTTCLTGDFAIAGDDQEETQLSDAFRNDVNDKFQKIFY